MIEEGLALVAAYEAAMRAYGDQGRWDADAIGELVRLNEAWQRAELALLKHCLRHGAIRTDTAEYTADADADLRHRRFMGPTVRGLIR